MDKKLKTLIGFVILVVLLGGASIAYSFLSPLIKPTDTDSEKTLAQDFTVLDKDGNSVKLSSLFGKPMVLNFWASWCPPCKAEMPHFNEIYKELKDDVTFVMVDMIDGQRETMDIGKEFIKEKGYVFPVYYDTTQEAAIKYEISSIPTTMIIDKDGYIVDSFQGMVDEFTLRGAIEKAK